MNLVMSIPDDLVTRLRLNGPDPARQVLEALVLETYRAGRMTTAEVRHALGFEVLNEVDGFLKAHGIFEPYAIEDIDRDVQAMTRLGP